MSTTGESTKSHTRTHTYSHALMTPLTHLRDPSGSLCLTSKAVIGKCNYLKKQKKTAFSSGNGLWRFKMMPFGLCNAPVTFERLMEQVLVGLPTSTTLVYLDDILIPGRSFSQQISNLREVFGRLRNAKLKLSPNKCVLFQREVKYLGLNGE